MNFIIGKSGRGESGHDLSATKMFYINCMLTTCKTALTQWQDFTDSFRMQSNKHDIRDIL